MKKTCIKCEEEKELSEFHKSNGRHLLGVVSKCKRCVSWYQNERRIKARIAKSNKKVVIKQTN
jgi:hypothetical protein